MSLSRADLNQLHFDILEYITKRSRIMTCRRLRTWNEFSDHYNFQYSDYSREDLRREFLETILPKVHTFNLTSIQKRKVEIFATHIAALRTEQGYQIAPPNAGRPIEGFHFARCKGDAQSRNLSCIVRDSSETQTPTPDQKVHAWTSAVSSTDEELAVNRLHSEKTIQSRANQSKEEFQGTGSLPPNLNSAVGKKIIDYRTELEKMASRVVHNLRNSN